MAEHEFDPVAEVPAAGPGGTADAAAGSGPAHPGGRAASPGVKPRPLDSGRPARLAVVIPALDEAERLPLLLDDLSAIRVPHQVVVVDGGSRDATPEAAAAAGARVIHAPRGRARQIRAGVEATRSPWIFLVHADSRLPPSAARALESWLAEASPADSAHFAFALEGRGAFWRFLELGQRLRERLTGLVYGDQGLVLSRQTWDAIGGVPDVPLMEDVGLVDRARRRGRVHRLPASLPTSPRRWEDEGRWRGWLRNAALVGLYRLGVSPSALARFYPTRGRSDGEPARSAVVVFVRAPRPGTVKTRLAADVGPEAATRIYRRMGRTLVDRLRGGPWDLIVAYDPPDGEAEVRSWLGKGPRYVPQPAGDLGARMADALRDALDGADRACVVGSDVPALDAGRVAAALDALDRHDLVVGPSEDGGYYLLAVRGRTHERVRDALFRDVPWSTPDVLSTTLARARARGLEIHLLEPLRDVDTVADLPADLR